MKKHDVIRIGLMVIISSQISTAQKLIWEDNFDGETLCTNRWEHCPEVPRADNSYWCDDDAYLDGEGNLQVRIREDADGNIQCGAINSRDLLGNQLYWHSCWFQATRIVISERSSILFYSLFLVHYLLYNLSQ